jgi:acid phosphatase type 7
LQRARLQLFRCTLCAREKERKQGGAKTRRFLGTLNTPVTMFVVLIVVVAVSGFLIFGYHPSSGTTNGVPPTALVVAAGTIANCGSESDKATAELLEGIDRTVLTLGDHVYPDGSAKGFAGCYDPTWGRFKERTRPTPGNHDYETEGASAYFDYFGDAAGDPQKGYYSYELGSWHLVALNSNCSRIGGCGEGSAQLEWLRRELAANPARRCILAYMHHPRYSSGAEPGSHANLDPLWEALYEAGADVVLSGDDRNYQRFEPQDPDGKADSERGIRQFVVGTGGSGHDAIESPIENLEVYNDDTYGVLKISLKEGGYEWRFVPVQRKTFTDSGSARCLTLGQ